MGGLARSSLVASTAGGLFSENSSARLKIFRNRFVSTGSIGAWFLLASLLACCCLAACTDRSDAFVLAVTRGNDLYPIAFYTKGDYRSITTGGFDNMAEAKESNREFYSFAKGIDTFDAFSIQGKIGDFEVTELAYGQGLSCEYNFTLKGTFRSLGKDGMEYAYAFISVPNRAIPHSISKVTEKWIEDYFRRNFFMLNMAEGKNVASIATETYVLRLNDKESLYFVEYSGRLKESMYYEPAGEQYGFGVWAVFHQEGERITRVNASSLSYDAPIFIWAGDADGDGNIEILLTEGHGETFYFVLYRFVSKKLVKIFTGTPYGC
jgi:hypothetical protein